MDNSAAEKEAFREISTMVYRHTDDDFFVKISKSCYKTIIDALYKQIPQKPVDAREYKYAKVGRCPNCNDGTNSEFPYCSMCDSGLIGSDNPWIGVQTRKNTA